MLRTTDGSSIARPSAIVHTQLLAISMQGRSRMAAAWRRHFQNGGDDDMSGITVEVAQKGVAAGLAKLKNSRRPPASRLLTLVVTCWLFNAGTMRC
jgi:hypothetical protein